MGFFRNAASVFATSLVNVPIGLATSVILARWLSVEDRGLYSVAVSFATIAALLLQLGWPSASIYRLKRVRSDPAQVTSAALVAATAASLLLIGVTLAFEQAISERLLGGARPRVLYLALAVVPFQLVATLLAAVARGVDRFGIQNTFQIAVTALTLITTAGVLMLGDGSLEAALAALLVSQVVATVVFTVLVVRQTGLTWRVAPAELREGLRFGLKSYLQSLAGRMHERVDVLLLAYLLRDPEQIALYTIAVGVIQRLKVLPEAVGTALLPRLSGMPEAEAARFTRFVCRHAFAWSVLISLGLALCAPLLLTLLYGEAYRESVTPFLILLPGMLLLTIYRVLARYFTAIDRQQANIWSQVASLVVNVGLNLLWIPRYGIAGSAAASLVSYALEAILILVVFRSVAGGTLRETLVWQAGDLADYRQRLGALARRARAAR
jgi:O-antigen/teichoic acid export membrane protein